MRFTSKMNIFIIPLRRRRCKSPFLKWFALILAEGLFGPGVNPIKNEVLKRKNSSNLLDGALVNYILNESTLMI